MATGWIHMPSMSQELLSKILPEPTFDVGVRTNAKVRVQTLLISVQEENQHGEPHDSAAQYELRGTTQRNRRRFAI